MTSEVPVERDWNQCEIAPQHGVTEGTVRYQLRRAAEEGLDRDPMVERYGQRLQDGYTADALRIDSRADWGIDEAGDGRLAPRHARGR